MTYGAVVINIAFAGMAGSGAVYDVTIDGEPICSRVKDPEHDSARHLAAAGVGLDERIVFCRFGMVTMTGRLGWFAGHRTAEGADSPPKSVGWAPYFGPSGFTSRNEDEDETDTGST